MAIIIHYDYLDSPAHISTINCRAENLMGISGKTPTADTASSSLGGGPSWSVWFHQICWWKHNYWQHSQEKNMSIQCAPQNCHLQDLPHTAYHIHHCQGTWTDFSFYSVPHIWIISQLWLDIRCLKPSRRTPYLQRGHARCMEASQAGRHGECQTQVRFAPFALVLVLSSSITFVWLFSVLLGP